MAETNQLEEIADQRQREIQKEAAETIEKLRSELSQSHPITKILDHDSCAFPSEKWQYELIERVIPENSGFFKRLFLGRYSQRTLATISCREPITIETYDPEPELQAAAKRVSESSDYLVWVRQR